MRLRQVQHERPARQHRQQRRRRAPPSSELRARERRAKAPSAARSARRLERGVRVAWPAPALGGGAGGRGVRGRAGETGAHRCCVVWCSEPRGSPQHTAGTCACVARAPARLDISICVTLRDEGPGRRRGRRRRGVRRDRPASRRSSSRSCWPTSRSSARGRRPSGSASRIASAPSASTPPSRARAGRADRPRAPRRGPERLRPALQRADLRRRLRGAGHLSGHGDDAVAPASRAPVRAAGGDARRRAARPARGVGAAPACWRWSGSASSPACPTSSPATPPTSCSRASPKSGVRDGADLVVEGYDFAPTFSIWTTIEECLNPPLDLGARARLLHHARRSPSPRCSSSPRASARSNA